MTLPRIPSGRPAIATVGSHGAPVVRTHVDHTNFGDYFLESAHGPGYVALLEWAKAGISPYDATNDVDMTSEEVGDVAEAEDEMEVEEAPGCHFHKQ